MPVPASAAGVPARGDGLRRLAVLVNDALLAMVTPELSFGGAAAGVGGLRMDVIDMPSAQRATRPRPRPRPHPASSPHPTAAGTGAPEPAPDMDSDHVETWRLVQLAQGGDGEAFGQLYDRYFDMVYRFIYYRVNDRALAEDFTSETFLRALRRISTISYQGRDIGAWFVTIARNIVLDHVKSARNRLETTTGDTIEPDERAQSTEAAVLEVLTSERLMQAVQQLGDEQRECVMLRFIQGLSVAETAQIMGKNDGAIKALQHRAVRKLADLIGSDLS